MENMKLVVSPKKQKKMGNVWYNLILLYLCGSLISLPNMETAAVSATRDTPNFVSSGKTFAKPKTARVLDNDFFISLTKEIQNGLKTPPISRKEVLAVIKSGNINPEVVEELEDAILGQMIDEGLKGEYISEEEFFKFLRK